jgi:hypothetical protein
MKNFRITGISTFTYRAGISTVSLVSGCGILLQSIADNPFTFDHHL